MTGSQPRESGPLAQLRELRVAAETYDGHAFERGEGSACGRCGLPPLLHEPAICEWCGGEITDGSTCPKSLECPYCHARPGSRCKRPSGHEAAELHADRVKAAETLDSRALDEKR